MPLSAESASGPKKPIANFKFAMEGLEARRLFTAGDSTTIVKLEVYEQTSEAVPTTPNDYLASIVVNEDASGTAITSASLTTPNQGNAPLSEDNASSYSTSASATTLAELDSGVPGGAYSLNVVDANGNHTYNFSIPTTDQFPSTPAAIVGYSALQSVDASQNLTLNWSPLAGGTSSDYVQVQINGNGAIAYTSPDIGSAGALNGTSTSIMIPAGTLAPDGDYICYLIYANVVSVDTTDYPAVPAYVAFATNTQFDMHAASALAAPIDVAASQGTFPHHTTVSWAAVTGAASYQVYRSTVDNFAVAKKLTGGVTGTDYSDTTAAGGVLHYYWVLGRNGSDIGPASASVSGFTEMPAPGNVTATDETHHVQITWSAIATATSYQIFRSVTDDFGTATRIAAGITTTFFSDTTAESGITYYYWVRGKNGAIVGIAGGPVMGALS